MSERFTLEPVEWAAWIPPVDASTATPRQRAALEAVRSVIHHIF